MADQADTIFGEESPTQSTVENTTADQPTGDQPIVKDPVAPAIPEDLSGWIGEGKKYSSLEEALKSIPHAQQHISTLENDNKAFKEQIEKVKSMEELLEQIKTQQAPKDGNTNPQVSYDADDLLSKLSGQLDSLVEQKLTLKNQQEVQSKNTKTVVDSFKEAYGDKAEEAYNRLSEDIGMDVATLNSLASTSPKALLKMAGINSQKAPVISNKSTVNTEAFYTNANNQPQQAKPVMFGASSSEVQAAWRASKPQS